MCTLWLPEGAVHGAPLVAGPTSVAGSPVVMVLVAGPTSAAVVAGGDGAGRCQMVDLVLGAAGRHWPLVLHGAPLVAGPTPVADRCGRCPHIHRRFNILRYTIVCNGIPLKMAGGRSQCDPYID